MQDLSGSVASKSLTIVGAGQAKTIIDGAATTRVFEIASGTGATVSVLIQHLSVSHGNATDGGQLGGSSALGGGFLIEGGNVTLSDVAMRSDQANGADGKAGIGAFNGSSGGNGQNARGGAIYLASGSLNLVGSLVDHGVAHAGAGGKGGSGGINGASAANGAAGSAGPNGATAPTPPDKVRPVRMAHRARRAKMASPEPTMSRLSDGAVAEAMAATPAVVVSMSQVGNSRLKTRLSRTTLWWAATAASVVLAATAIN